MKHHVIPNAEFEERSFGSSLDPLLIGVAHGLATLFPPIENAHRPESEAEAGQLHEAEDGCMDD